jgi:hypothetical protein
MPVTNSEIGGPLVFDLLMSADLSVEGVDATAATIVAVFGLPEPRRSWVHDTPEAGVRTYFLRPQLDRANAPTTIEVIGPHPEGGWSESLRAIHELQGDRPMKTHATVFGVPEVEPYVTRLDDLGIPYRLDPGVEGPLPFPKLWVGQQHRDDVTTYVGTHDAGLVVELIPTAPLLLPADVATPPAMDVPEGAVVRIASRSFLVDNVETAAAMIERTFGWQPSGGVGMSDVDHCRVGSYRGAFPGSGALELLEPTGDGPAADYHSRFGPGAYRITFAVNGLAAAAGWLDERGVRYTLDQGSGAGVEPPRLRVDPSSMAGMVFDLVDCPVD